MLAPSLPLAQGSGSEPEGKILSQRPKQREDARDPAGRAKPVHPTGMRALVARRDAGLRAARIHPAAGASRRWVGAGAGVLVS